MIKISGSSDDLIEVTIRNPARKELTEDEFDSFGKSTVFKFDDGTKMRMVYKYGTWMAEILERGTAMISIEPLVNNDDWYSDLFTIETDIISSHWKE